MSGDVGVDVADEAAALREIAGMFDEAGAAVLTDPDTFDLRDIDSVVAAVRDALWIVGRVADLMGHGKVLTPAGPGTVGGAQPLISAVESVLEHARQASALADRLDAIEQRTGQMDPGGPGGTVVGTTGTLPAHVVDAMLAAKVGIPAGLLLEMLPAGTPDGEAGGTQSERAAAYRTRVDMVRMAIRYAIDNGQES